MSVPPEIPSRPPASGAPDSTVCEDPSATVATVGEPSPPAVRSPAPPDLAEPPATIDGAPASPQAEDGSATVDGDLLDPGATVSATWLFTAGGGEPLPGTAVATVAFEPPPSGGRPASRTPGSTTEVMEATGIFGPTGAPSDEGCATTAFDAGQTAPGGETPGYAPTEALDVTGAYAATLPETSDGAGPAPVKSKPPVPAEGRCGRYVLKRFHARGGMGEVWMAEDPDIGRPVALKRMLGQRPDQVRRFRVEAQVTGQLEHPGVVPVHELGVTDQGHPFYAMKFVQGRTLKKVIEEFHAKSLAPGERELEQVRMLQMFISLCQTVAYAHSRGVIHRDLKPENVMLGPYGETILLDWGIAKVKGQAEPEAAAAGGAPVHALDSSPETETQAGAIMGTPSYMSPEVAAGLVEEVDERSDIYLLGGTLYEMLTGRQPRTAKTAFELIRLAKEEPPPPARTANPLVPKALEAICQKAMAHRKADRYATALALAEDLQRFVAGEPVSAYREDFRTRAWRWAKRHRTALLRSAAALLFLGFSSFAVAKVRQAEHRRAEALLLAERLKGQERARNEVAEFRRLADEANYAIATTNPVAEDDPYSDPARGEEIARSALAVAAPWGATLEGLPLPAERVPLRKELSDLLLLTAQLRGRKPGAESGKEVLGILDRAARLHEPSSSDFRLRAVAYRARGDEARAAAEEARARGDAGPLTARDYFMLAENARTETLNITRARLDGEPWKPELDEMEKVVDLYRRALMLDPNDYWARFQLARCQISLGLASSATEAFGACIALRPDSPWGYSARGLALAQQGRHAEAEEDFNRAIQLSPKSRQPRLNRGVLYAAQKREREALADFDAVLQPPAESRLVEAAYWRGILRHRSGDDAQALKDFDLLLGEKPNFREAYPLRAQVHLALGHTRQGLADLDAYLSDGRSYDPRSWRAHALRGRLLRYYFSGLPVDRRNGAVGRTLAKAALAELGGAYALGGRDSELFDDLGAMLEHAGDLKQAIAAYTRGLESAPRFVRMRLKRGWAFEQLQLHDKALADFAAAADVEPENAEAHTGVGYVRAVGRLPAEAQREADLALLHGGDKYLILHNVACIYATLAESDPRQGPAHQEAAVAVLRRALALWKKADSGPNEIDLMKGEPAFKSLRGRRDFRDLLRQAAPGPALSAR